MVKILTEREEESLSRLDPSIFERLCQARLLTSKTYPRGRRGVVLRSHKFLGRETHVDPRLPDDKFLLELPIDYVRTID